jgi:hypothetical protein
MPNLGPLGESMPNLGPLGESMPNLGPLGQTMPNLGPKGKTEVPFHYDHIPAVPVSSLYDMPAVVNAAAEPWGMPYPQMNAYFNMPPADCGCSGSKQGKMSGWAGNLPNSHWLPYARPVQYPDYPPQGGSVHEARLAGGEADESDGGSAPQQAKTSQVSAEKTAKSSANRQTRNKQSSMIAKIRRLSAGSGKKQAYKKKKALPWLNH